MKTSAALAAIRDHYDRLSPLYARFWGEHIHHGFWRNGESSAEAQQNLIEELAARAGIARGSHMLDVGCGLGGSALWLARELGCSILGITLSPVQVAIATKRARSKGLDHLVHFKVEDANQLELPDESFDAVWTVECTEHLFDKPRFFHRCARVLKTGGRLAVCAWLAQGAAADQRAMIERLVRPMLCPSLGSLDDYVAWMRGSGFEKISAEDIAPQVAKTWRHAETILSRPEVKLILRASNRATRDFAESFALMSDAYERGAMGYGMFTARKPTHAFT